METIAVSPKGHIVKKNKTNYSISYSKDMLVFSTSQLNGGINTLKNCFNHKLTSWVDSLGDLPGGNIKKLS
jgi:hypothetical protein